MTLGPIVGFFADVHGAHETLRRALTQCRAEGVTHIVLLGDLIDRTEQADACAEALGGWPVVGVYGNHEREFALAAAEGQIALRDETIRLLGALRETIVIEDVCLTHDAVQWSGSDSLPRLIRPPETRDETIRAWLTFSGHTHYRVVRDERGPVDIGRGRITLDPRRRYLINPGALAVGEFAIWDRAAQVIQFRQV